MAGARRPRASAALRTARVVVPALFLLGGVAAVSVALGSQVHAPQPTASEAGTLGPSRPRWPSLVGARDDTRRAPSDASAPRRAPASSGRSAPPSLERSRPVLLRIPAIGVSTKLLVVGRNPNGTIQVPPLFARPSEAAWYRYSPTPGERGPSVILGHVDNVDGPAVFFRLGALRPGERIEVRLADGTVGVFRVDGVRRYPKSGFPTRAVYGPVDFAALRLITCGGPFDDATRQYLDNIVVFASLVTSHPVQTSTTSA